MEDLTQEFFQKVVEKNELQKKYYDKFRGVMTLKRKI